MDLADFSCSEKLTSFSAALTKFQAEGITIKKDSENPHFRSTYASLPQVLETINEPLKKNGFAVMQMPLGGVDICRLLVRVMHTSGEWVQWVFSTPIAKKDPQGIAAATTYLRRYSLTSAFGLPEDDDDGNTASKAPQQTPARQPQQSGAGGAYRLTEKQEKFIYARAKQSGWTIQEVASFVGSKFSLSDWREMNRQQIDTLLEVMQGGLYADLANGAAEQPSHDGIPF